MDWDLTAYFPSFGSPEHLEFDQALGSDLSRFAERLEALAPLARTTFDVWDDALVAYESLGVRLEHLRSYVSACSASDGRNPEYRKADAEIILRHAQLAKLDIRLMSGCAGASELDFEEWLSRPRLAGAEYYLRRLRERARHSMSMAQEDLATDLGTDGIEAWGRLYDQLTATLSFEMSYPDGSSERLPMSARRSLLENEDRRVRKAAFEGGHAAFRPLLPTLAAALNHIAGTRLTLSARRGYADFLEPALVQGGLSRATLDAMWAAVERERAIPERILRIKARALGVDRLAWFDLAAPFPRSIIGAGAAASQPIEWARATSMVSQAFLRQYPALAQFFDAAIEKRWVDFQRRDGKRPGAFCTSSPLIKESRVFMTFQGTSGDVSTLAHEIGHAWHGHVLGSARYLASRYPMTLAESASTFAELMLADGLAKDPSLEPLQGALHAANVLNDAATFLMDIPARFFFERAFYEERARGQVEPERLAELMAAAQRRAVGEVLHPEGVDPLFWATKLHFFITSVSFYNFPYTFGYLLSRGLFAEFQRQGAEFLPRYEQFLRRSASADAPEVVRQTLGVDLEQPEFWQRSIESLKGPLETLEARLSPLAGPSP